MATTIRAMLNTDRKTVSGYYPLVIRVIHDRRKKLIYSPYKLRESDFDDSEQKVRWSEKSPYSTKQISGINKYIDKQKVQIHKITRSLHQQTNGSFGIDDITTKYHGHKICRYLFNYIDKEVESKAKSKRFGTATLYRTTKESLKRFTKREDILLSDINYSFVCDYIDHLKERDITLNSIHMYLRNLRAIYNKAVKEGLVQPKRVPFEDINMNGTATVKRAISKDIMRRIAYADISFNTELEQVRDVFMFSFYSRGMSLVDMLFLKHSDIKNGVIYYARNKTNQNIEITITQPLQNLIDKYRSDSVYVLPYVYCDTHEAMYRQYRKSLTHINKCLKRIGVLLDINTPLTTYVARHSWATIAKNEGAPIAAISEGLGHTTEKTTQIYLKAFDRSVIDEVNAKVVVL